MKIFSDAVVALGIVGTVGLVYVAGLLSCARAETVPVSDPRVQAALEQAAKTAHEGWLERDAERKKREAERAAAHKQELQRENDTRTLAGVPAIGEFQRCGNHDWVAKQDHLRRVVDVCAAIYRQYSPVARALGGPGFRLRNCTTRLWYKLKKPSLNIDAILYHPDQLKPPDAATVCTGFGPREPWPWECEAWHSCMDGQMDRLRGW